MARELTAEEKRIYNKMIRGSKQITIEDFLDLHPAKQKKDQTAFPEDTGKKVIYSQMELFGVDDLP